MMFHRKPQQIEAIRLKKFDEHTVDFTGMITDPDLTTTPRRPTGAYVLGEGRVALLPHDGLSPNGEPICLLIPQGLGIVVAQIGDWIIKDESGLHPMKHDDFVATYE